MKLEKIEYINTAHSDDLTARLKGNVFHLTPLTSFESISADKMICHNKDGKYPVYAGSAHGFGKNRGYVPFFNFKDVTDETISDTLNRYYFVDPTWFRKYYPDYSEANLAYLFLGAEGQKDLIPNSQAREECKSTGQYEQYVPGTEFWYPGNVPLDLIEKVLLVKIYNDAPKENIMLYAHHMLLVNE